MSLTRAQKKVLGDMIINEAGSIVEFFSEKTDYLTMDQQKIMDGVQVSDCREQLAKWMEKIPSNFWDDRLDP